MTATYQEVISDIFVLGRTMTLIGVGIVVVLAIIVLLW